MANNEQSNDSLTQAQTYEKHYRLNLLNADEQLKNDVENARLNNPVRLMPEVVRFIKRVIADAEAEYESKTNVGVKIEVKPETKVEVDTGQV